MTAPRWWRRTVRRSLSFQGGTQRPVAAFFLGGTGLLLSMVDEALGLVVFVIGAGMMFRRRR